MIFNYRRFIGYLLMMAICVAVYTGLHWPDGRLHVYFLDIGQGDSIFIKTPSGEQILIDGGIGGAVIYELSDVMPFFDRSIDVVVATHPDKDHIGGLVDVLGRYDVEKLMITGVVSDSSDYLELLRRATDSEVIFVDDSEDFYLGEVFFDVLYPFDSLFGDSFENMNDSSIVMKMKYKDVDILLTGDLEVAGEKELLDAGVDLSADILKVGHHGSKSSSSLDFLREVGARVAVIQCGKNNPFGHPVSGVLENLQSAGVGQVLRTDLDGRVEYVF